MTSTPSLLSAVSRAQQMLSDMSSLDPSTVINISYVGESVEVLLRWESTYPLIIQILMERAEEVGGSSFCGAIAQYPQGNKRDCLFGESMTLAIIQDSIGTKNLHVGMFNFNLVPGGPRLHNKSRLDGHRLVKYLISNSSLFESTPILDVPGLPKNILEMATLHAVQIADYLHISLIDMNRLTLKQFHRWFSHVCIIKAFRESSRAAAIKANHAAKIAEHFGCDVSEVPNLTDRQIYSYVGKYYHPKEAVRELKKWYDKHESHPYPSKEEKEELASTTMLTEKQIKTWFKVERAKRKKAVSEHKEAVRKLREWYEENDSHPYPSKEEKEELASTTKLTEKQINQWFVRERLKRKKAAGETIASFERLPTETVDKLRKWYEENESNHYPSKEEREEFARTTGLTENKIRNWFMSERARRK